MSTVRIDVQSNLGDVRVEQDDDALSDFGTDEKESIRATLSTAIVKIERAYGLYGLEAPPGPEPVRENAMPQLDVLASTIQESIELSQRILGATGPVTPRDSYRAARAVLTYLGLDGGPGAGR